MLINLYIGICADHRAEVLRALLLFFFHHPGLLSFYNYPPFVLCFSDFKIQLIR